MRRTDKLNLKLRGQSGELYTLDDTTPCPCTEVYGQYSPEWHFNNPAETECENGVLADWTHDTVYFKIVDSEFSNETKPQGILPKNSLRILGCVYDDLSEVDFSELNRTNSYLLIDSTRYVITGVSKEFLQGYVRNIIEIELCSL